MSTTTPTLTSPLPVIASRRAVAPQWLGFGVVLLCAVMDLLDSTITQTAAPAIRRSLHGTAADLQWISAAYTLAMAGLLLLGGRLGDVLGRRRVLLWGMSGFTLASALCAVSPSTALLVAGRALQGSMAAMMIPQGFGLIRELFGDDGQQRALGVFGPVMGLAAVAGPLAGGGLIAADVLGIGWRAIFLINVPIGVAAVLAGRRLLPGARAGAERASAPDVISVALAGAGSAGLVYPLIQGRQEGWPLWSFAVLALGVALLVAFAVRQGRRRGRGRAPLVEPSILRRRPYLAGMGVVLGFIGAMGAIVLVLNVMFQGGLGFSPLGSAVATIPIPLAAIAGSITSSVLLARLGRGTMHIGLAVMAVSLAAVAIVLRSAGGGLSAWDLTAPLTGAGFGMGMVFVPMFDVILAGVAAREIGSASGLLGSVQQLAMSLGIAAGGTVLFDSLGATAGRAPFVQAAGDALIVPVALLVAAWLAVFLLPRHARR